MKLILKVILIVVLTVIILISDLALVGSIVRADFIGEEIMYQKTYCDKILGFSTYMVGTAFVVYAKDGVEYPAYCLEPDLPGIGEVETYNVTVTGKINDVQLWRVLINGYPYKSIEELGVANEKEAYLATKQAIYCYIRNRDTSKYFAKDEAGYRTLNALNQIVNNAKNSTEVPESPMCEITAIQNEWKQDEINKNYVSKTFKINSNTTIKDYTVSITGDYVPEGIQIVDINNNEKHTFQSNENFKILIPIYNLNNDGIFTLNIDTESLTKPVLYGLSQVAGMQNYALTVYEFEQSKSTLQQNYGENKTTINILKQDLNTKQPLQGTEFQLLNEKQEVIYANLVTDEDGKITISKLLPGTYYLKEVRAVDGYINYDELIEIKINLNETVNITVNNSKENRIEISKKEKEIEITQEKTIEIRKLPITGM